MRSTSGKYSHYIEELARNIPEAKPYFKDSPGKLEGEGSKANSFPNQPGVYLILRRVNLPDNDYTTRGVNTKSPIVIMLGKPLRNEP